MDIKLSPVKIAYTDPAGVYPELRKELECYVPLVNLHYSPENKPLRTVAQLDIEMVPSKSSGPQHQILGLSGSPFVQIFLLEAANLDIYRGTARRNVREWAKQLANSREPTGFLVVHYVGPGKRRSHKAFIKLEGDVPGHAAQIYLDTPQGSLERKEMWAHFTSALKAQILAGFGARVEAYKHEIRKLQSTRDVVGWNLGSMFVMNDSLADSFESMSFFEDAYQIYCELEKMADSEFFVSSLGHVPKSLLKTDRDFFTSQILAQKVSLFEFHCYLFTRQILVLIYISQIQVLTSSIHSDKTIAQLLEKALNRLPYLTTMLESVGASRIDSLSWLYRSIAELYGVSMAFSKAEGLKGRGELLLFQRSILKELAAIKGFTLETFTVVSLYNELESTGHQEVPLKNLDIDQLESGEDFRAKYLELSQLACSQFALTGSTSTVNELRAELALIAHGNGGWQSALELLKHVPEYYFSRKWYDLSVRLHLAKLDCATRLELPDIALKMAFGMLRMHGHLSVAQAENALEVIKHHKNLRTRSHHDLDLWAHTDVKPYIQGDQRYFIELDFVLKSPKTPFLSFDSAVINAVLDPNESARVVFKSGPIELVRGCRFYCETFVKGTVSLTSLNLHLGNQLITKKFDPPINIRLVPLQSCFHASLSPSKHFILSSREVILSMNSPVETKGRVQLKLDKNVSISQELQLNKGHTALKFPVTLDHTTPQRQVWVRIEYNDEPCFYIFEETLDLTLNVAVHLQEYYRKQQVYYEFLVNCSTISTIMIDKATLSCSSLFESLAPSLTKPSVAFNGTSVSYTFSLIPRASESIESDSSNASADLAFEVEYRATKWECAYILHSVALRAFPEELNDYKLVLQEFIDSLEFDEVFYVTQRKLRLLGDPVKKLESILLSIVPSLRPVFHASVSQVLHDLGQISSRGLDDNIAEVNVKVEIDVPSPALDVLHVISLELLDKRCLDEGLGSFRVGEAIPVHLKLEPVFKWSRKLTDAQQLENLTFTYEIDRSASGWSLAGTNSGVFTGPKSTELSLIPHKAGVLSLPRVTIKCSDPTVSMDTLYYDGMQQVVVVPEINRLAITF